MSVITECGMAVNQLSWGLSFLGTPSSAGDGAHSRGAAEKRDLTRGGQRRPDTPARGQASTHNHLREPSVRSPESVSDGDGATACPHSNHPSDSYLGTVTSRSPRARRRPDSPQHGVSRRCALAWPLQDTVRVPRATTGSGRG